MAHSDTAPRLNENFQPLADRIRPRSLDDFVGQQHLLADGKPLRRLLESGRVYSIVLWGPPGTGKTTLARLVARYAQARFVTLSAVMAGVKDIRDAVAQARKYRQETGRDTVLFIDEVHRFNKAQQDAFLPFVEDGTLTFIGATTENPSFELNNALLSRTRVYVLKPLQTGDVLRVMEQALSDQERGLGGAQLEFPAELREVLARASDGDARRALNVLEMAADLALTPGARPVITRELLSELLSNGTIRRFDNRGEAFYDEISALHKAVRGSDPDAALYWLARMLDGGCDPLYIARRLVRVASEDVGNADPRAIQLAIGAWDAQQRLGSPEGELALAQAAVYLACASKSNAVYTAFEAAKADVQNHGSLDVPLHLRNAPTRLMKELGYAKHYRYAHDEPEGYAAGERYFPPGMGDRQYYRPSPRGLEARIGERLAHFRELDRKHKIENG